MSSIEWTNRIRLEDMLTYYSAAYLSAGTPEQARIYWCSLKGIANAANTAFNSMITAAIDQAIIRPDDPFSSSIVRALTDCELV